MALNKPFKYIFPTIVCVGLICVFLFDLALFKKVDNDTNINTSNVISLNMETSNINILWNDNKFNELLLYYESINNKIKPSSFYELNDQLFCPIKHSKSLYPHTYKSNAQERLLREIYRLQFPNNCNDPNTKFLVFDLKLINSAGMMAAFNGRILKSFYASFVTQRTLLFTTEWSWQSKHKYCQNRGYTGFECFFMPISHCNVTEIIANAKKDDIVYIGKYDDKCDVDVMKKGNDTSVPICKQRVVVVDKLSDWYAMIFVYIIICSFNDIYYIK